MTRKAADISDITGVKPIKTRTDIYDISKFDKTVWLSSPTMYGAELKHMTEAYEQNWMSTIGHNIDVAERLACQRIGCKHAAALSCGTSALHLAVKLAGVKSSDKVFCSDMTFDATVNSVVYEGSVPVFIDTKYDMWNMNPKALEKAFELFPDVKVVVVANLYGTLAKLDGNCGCLQCTSRRIDRRCS